MEKQQELLIERLSFTGKGIGRVNKFVVFVPHTLPGDRVLVEITSSKRKYADAKVIEYLERSENAIEPQCPHFELCGGCSFQNLPYELQLESKYEAVLNHLIRIGKFEEPPLKDIVQAPNKFFYRNKMEFSFKPDPDNHLNLGLHHRGDWENIFDIENCQLQSEISNQIVCKARDFFIQKKVEAYHLSEHHGYLRFLIIRESHAQKSVMLILVTNSGEFADQDEFIEMITSEFPRVKSIVHVINETKSNVAGGGAPEILWGDDHIIEEIDGKKYIIKPSSFFQTNTVQTTVLYNKIVELADFSDDEDVLDLYTGCGSIAIHIAGLVNSVLGIELNPDAIIGAHENMKLNNIDNCQFIAGDVRKTLIEIIDSQQKFDTIIVDPPRAGIGKKVVKKLINLYPKKIIYVSCNPSSLAGDLNDICQAGYSLDQVCPVDMFPHTFHIESVSRLTRND